MNTGLPIGVTSFCFPWELFASKVRAVVPTLSGAMLIPYYYTITITIAVVYPDNGFVGWGSNQQWSLAWATCLVRIFLSW
jgi:hypothetical protein